MKQKENQGKKCHIVVSNPHKNPKNSVCMERNSLTPNPLGHRAIDIMSVITCSVQVNRTSWLRQNDDEKFCKIIKICLKQYNLMRIDELPYHSSLFYKLNFVSRKQVFINIGKYP